MNRFHVPKLLNAVIALWLFSGATVTLKGADFTSPEAAFATDNDHGDLPGPPPRKIAAVPSTPLDIFDPEIGPFDPQGIPPAPVLMPVDPELANTSFSAPIMFPDGELRPAGEPRRGIDYDFDIKEFEGCDDTNAGESLFLSKGTAATYTYLPAGSQEVSFNTFELEHVLEAPQLPRFRLTPRFGWNLVNDDPIVRPPNLGFNLTDIPAQLYETSVEAMVVVPIGERWSVLGSIAPGIYSDFRNMDQDAFRLPSQLVAFYQWSEAITLAAGVVYLDREDISTIGYFGFIAGNPDDCWKVEVLFPRSRIAYRISENTERAHWIYVAQEFIGGASWAMQYSYGMDDVVTYRDDKVLGGYEWVVDGQRRGFLEAGYVYDRELEFKRLGRGRLSSTGMVRFGLVF